MRSTDAESGKLEIEEQVTLVLLGDETGRSGLEAEIREHQETCVNRQRDQARPQQAAHESHVQSRAGAEEPVERAEKPAQKCVQKPGQRIAVAAMRFEQNGRQGRAQRERVEGRDHRGDGDRHRELAEELAGHSAEEGARDEHGAQHEGHGDHRPCHFVHRLAGRLARREPLFEPAFDVFDDDDRVVHHDADRQHKPEQRQVVERITQGGHHGKAADDGHGDGDQRDQGGPPVLQKDQHHEGDEDHGVAEGQKDFVHRLADEGGRVVDDAVVEPIGKAGLEVLHLGVDAAGGLQSVGAGELIDRERDRRLAVERAGLFVLLGPQFDARPAVRLAGHHVPQADDARGRRRSAALCRLPPPAEPVEPLAPAVAAVDIRPVGDNWTIGLPEAALMMMSPNCSGVVNWPSVLIVSSNCWPFGAGGWPIMPAATCRFCSLIAVMHVRNVDAEGGHLVGVEPGAEAVIALPEVGDACDAGKPVELVLEIDRRVVAEEQAVVAVIRRDEVDDHQRAGRHLLHVDPLGLHQGGNHRQRERDAVLHQHLGHVRVHAQLKGHGERVAAVVGRRRRHVDHAFDAADLLLDGNAHRVAHRLGIRAGVVRRHQHGGRRDIRVLGHRKRKYRHAASQHEHDRQDRGEDRAVDEEM